MNWLPVIGLEGLYEVSDQGDVQSLDRWVRCGQWGRRLVAGQRMTPQPLNGGHLFVYLSDGSGGKRGFLVHRMVLEAFVGPCPDGMEALHWDDDPFNNKLTNLRWGTRSENMRDKVRNGHDHNARRAECAYGHQLIPCPWDSKRYCPECRKRTNREYRLRQKTLVRS